MQVCLAPLQALVCCPVTKTPLSLVPLSELWPLLPKSERERLPRDTEGAFVSWSTGRAYPVAGRIARFLVEDALALEGFNDLRVEPADPVASAIKRGVRRWYDEFGWKRDATGNYNDTALFSQLGRTPYGFYEAASHLSILDRFLEGGVLLDAASGAIPNPEYLSYSWFYKYRVCVDFSLLALQEAQSKLGETGLFVLADVGQLPFLDGVFDGVISAYTVQHIPASAQQRTVSELLRVLKPGRRLCIITSIVTRSSMRGKFIRLLRWSSRLRQASAPVGGGRRQGARVHSGESLHGLYSQSRDLAWWHGAARELKANISIEALRTLGRDEFDSIFGDSIEGARLLRAMEGLFPRFLAAISANVLVDLIRPPMESGVAGSRLAP